MIALRARSYGASHQPVPPALHARRRLFTCMQVQFVHLLRGVPGRVQPPLDDLESYWRPEEEEWVQRALARSFVGTAATIEQGLRPFIGTDKPDERMISGHF